MEQQLINVLIKLVAKTGGGSLVKDLIQQVDENRNPKVWTSPEIQKAISLVEWQVENFGAADAEVIIETLLHKYNLQPERFLSGHAELSHNNVMGLQ